MGFWLPTSGSEGVGSDDNGWSAGLTSLPAAEEGAEGVPLLTGVVSKVTDWEISPWPSSASLAAFSLALFALSNTSSYMWSRKWYISVSEELAELSFTNVLNFNWINHDAKRL